VPDFKKNDLVQHPLMPEWGLGRIISDDSRGTRIYFSKQGMKVLRLDKMDWNLKRLKNVSESLVEAHKQFLSERNIFYKGAKARLGQKTQRDAMCYTCKNELDSRHELQCCTCNWILCFCGSCGCGHPIYGERYIQKGQVDLAFSDDSYENRDLEPECVFHSFSDASEFAIKNPGSKVIRHSASSWKVMAIAPIKNNKR
jgi:hypothetical protein